MELGEGDYPLAAGPGRKDARLERSKRNAHVGWMRGNAVLACAEDRVHAVDATDRSATAPGRTFVAGRARIVEIEAARSLQQVAAGRCHVAQLRRGAGEDGARKQRIACLDLRVPGEVAVGHQRADAQAPTFNLLDLVERQVGYVDHGGGKLYMLLDEVDEIRSAGDKL